MEPCDARGDASDEDMGPSPDIGEDGMEDVTPTPPSALSAETAAGDDAVHETAAAPAPPVQQEQKVGVTQRGCSAC